MFKDIDRKDRVSNVKKPVSSFKDIDRKDRTASKKTIYNNVKPTREYNKCVKSTLFSEFEDEIKIIPKKQKE